MVPKCTEVCRTYLISYDLLLVRRCVLKLSLIRIADVMKKNEMSFCLSDFVENIEKNKTLLYDMS